jgi:hypothetical protein
MANPFYIKPASMLPGFTSFLSGVESRADYERKKTKKAKQETIRKQAAGLAQSGNTDELYKLTLENPWLTDEVTKSSKWHNEEIKTDAIESARRVLMGESPGQVGIEHAEKVIQAGGDATKQIEQIKQDQLEPEAAIKRAEMFLLFHDPQTYKALKESQKTEDPKQQIVNGQLVTIGPDGKAIASQIEGLQGLDAPKSDYDRWKQNPAEFAQFRAAGRERGEGGGNKPPAGYRYTPDGNLVYIPGGPADPATKSVRDQPTKALPASQVESLLDMQNVAKALKEATDIASKKKVQTGPVSGRLQALASKVGMADDSFVDMNQRLQTASNIMLKLRSGAAVTESEYARFIKEYPQPNDPKEVRERKAKNSIRYMNELIDDKVTAFGESGYKTPNIKPVEVPGEQPGALPPEAVSKLQAGKITAFKNGQKWTLGQNGQPQRVQ